MNTLKYLTVREVADYWRVTPQTVYKMMRSGDLEHIRIGSQYRIPRVAVEESSPVEVSGSR